MPAEPQNPSEDRVAQAVESLAASVESLTTTVESVVLGQAELVTQLLAKLEEQQAMADLPPALRRRVAMERARELRQPGPPQ